MKRFILPSVLLTILLLTFSSSTLAKDGEGHKGANGNGAKGKNTQRQGGGNIDHHGRQHGHGGRYHGNHGHHRHRPNWGFGLWAPPVYPYYQPYFRPMPPRPYMRPYGGYYRPGNFGFFFNF